MKESDVLPGPSPQGQPRKAKLEPYGAHAHQSRAAHQDLRQLLLLAFPGLFAIHLSGFLPCPKTAEKVQQVIASRTQGDLHVPLLLWSLLQWKHPLFSSGAMGAYIDIQPVPV